MKFLEQIDALERRTQELLDANGALSSTLAEARLQTASLQAVIDSAPKSEAFGVELSGGRTITVSERDSLRLFTAMIANLDREAVNLCLVSGDAVSIDIGDLEQIARQINAKAAPVAAGAPVGG